MEELHRWTKIGFLISQERIPSCGWGRCHWTLTSMKQKVKGIKPQLNTVGLKSRWPEISEASVRFLVQISIYHIIVPDFCFWEMKPTSLLSRRQKNHSDFTVSSQFQRLCLPNTCVGCFFLCFVLDFSCMFEYIIPIDFQESLYLQNSFLPSASRAVVD